MKNTKVKGLLLTAAGLIGAPAMAQEAQVFAKIKLIDELPVQYRANIYSRLVEHLNQNPEIALNPDHVLGVHESGAILVLNKKWAKAGVLGAPSCIEKYSGSHDGAGPEVQNGLDGKGIIYVFDGALLDRGTLGAPSCIPE
jgi:hypothetical protein